MLQCVIPLSSWERGQGERARSVEGEHHKVDTYSLWEKDEIL
jgi:hypothetical protein